MYEVIKKDIEQVKYATILSYVRDEIEQCKKIIKQTLFASEKVFYHNVINYFSDKNKYIRPILFLLLTQFKKQNNYNCERIKIASAIEIIHTATLIHDDIIDEADARRGIETLNLKFNNKLALLAGDYLFSKAMEILSNIDYAYIKQISSTCAEMAKEEFLYENSSIQYKLNRDVYFKNIAIKTGYLLKTVCSMAGIYNKDHNLEDYENFGLNLGIAFQIVDDLLDINSNEKILGKNVNHDLLCNNITLPLILLYESYSKEEKDKFIKILKTNTLESKKYIISLLKNFSFASTQTIKIAFHYIEKSKKLLHKLNNNINKQKVSNLIDYIIQRER